MLAVPYSARVLIYKMLRVQGSEYGVWSFGAKEMISVQKTGLCVNLITAMNDQFDQCPIISMGEQQLIIRRGFIFKFYKQD